MKFLKMAYYLTRRNQKSEHGLLDITRSEEKQLEAGLSSVRSQLVLLGFRIRHF